MSRWPEVAIGEVADPVDRSEAPIPGVAYRQVGVRLWGEGAYERETIDGAETKYKMLNRVEAGDIIVNKIWARNGSVSVVSDDLAGCYCSGEFPLFQPRPDRLDPRWFYWITKTRWFWERCDEQSRGTSGKNRLREQRFLEIPIPLAPLEEQRRVVRRIEQLAALLATAERVRLRVERDIEALAKASFQQAFSAYGETSATTIDDVCTAVIDCLHSNPVYAEAGIATMRSPDVGWGELKLDGALRTSEEEYCRRTQRGEPRSGDIILVREGGGTGRAGIVGEGQRLSLGQRVMLLRPDPARVDPRFLLLQWLSPRVQDDQIAPRIKGSASPHLNIGALRQFSVVLPPLSEQVRLVDRLDQLLGRIECTQRLLAGAGSFSGVVLPSALSGILMNGQS